MGEIPGMVEEVKLAICCPMAGICEARAAGRDDISGRVAVCHAAGFEEEARAAIAAHEAALRDAGMVIVPREATREIKDAYWAVLGFENDGPHPAVIWRAMVAAAHRCSTTDPESTRPVGGGEGEP